MPSTFRFLRHRVPLPALLATCLAVSVGCGDDEERTAGPAGPGAGPGGGGVGGNIGGAGGTPIIPDTPCEDAATPAVDVFAAGSNLQISRLVAVGTRWVASGELGYAYFDRDGANPDEMPTTLGDKFNVVSDEGGLTAGLASASATFVGYQRLDDMGPITGPRVLGNVEPDVVVSSATDAGDSISVWGWNGKLEGRTVDAMGDIAGDAFDVAIGAYSGAVRLRAVNGGEAIALARYGAADPGVFQSWFQMIGPTGPMSEPVLFYTSTVQHDLVDIARTMNGYAVLIVDADTTTQILQLDAAGDVIAKKTGLAGTAIAYGMASKPDAIAVVTGRQTGEPQLRVFDLSLAPLGPWVCLGPTHDPSVPATIAVDGDGWAVTYATMDGRTMLSRVDAVGTGAPQ